MVHATTLGLHVKNKLHVSFKKIKIIVYRKMDANGRINNVKISNVKIQANLSILSNSDGSIVMEINNINLKA